MIIHENKKISKIVDEMTLYLVKKGHLEFTMKFSYQIDEEVKIIFETDELDEKVTDKLLKYISRKREREVEEYGWELLGESDSSSELEMLGLLVDTINITNENGKSTIVLSRKYSK